MIKVTPLHPKRKITAREAKRAIVSGYRRAAADAVKAFRSATASWKHKPTIEIIYDRDGIPSVIVHGDVFYFVDVGTDPHTIAPKGGFLRFQAGFTAKTTPGSLASGPGGSFGPYVFTRKPIEHPGTKPRGFSEAAKRRADDDLGKFVGDELRKVIR
jgi:hypothetical protein